MKKSQMEKLLQYINEFLPGVNRRDFAVIGRLQHELLDSTEPDTPLRSGWMTLSCGHAYVGYYHECGAEVTCSICKARSIILAVSVGDKAKPKVDYEVEYFKLYRHLEDIRATVGLPPHPTGGLNPSGVYSTVVGLMSRIAELQRCVTGRYPYFSNDPKFSIDYNLLVHLIKNLVKP